MMQISTLTFSLLIELLVFLVIVLIVWTILTLKRQRRDREAAARLIEQMRHQSELRLKETGSFLEEKYHFEGDQLNKAIQSIDKAEKKFAQNIINMYLQRSSSDLLVLDAQMAEMIDTYKDLKPVAPDISEDEIVTDVEGGTADELQLEVERLRETNEKLSEELTITKKTMGNMIAEFGNMFGGGQDSALEGEEVLEKVNVAEEPEVETDSSSQSESEATSEPVEPPAAEPEQPEAADTSPTDEINSEMLAEVEDDEPKDFEAGPVTPADVQNAMDAESEADRKKLEKDKKVPDASITDFDEGIDELMDGIDLSDE